MVKWNENINILSTSEGLNKVVVEVDEATVYLQGSSVDCGTSLNTEQCEQVDGDIIDDDIIDDDRFHLSKRHNKVLVSIFNNPISGTIKWSGIEALFKALNATIEEREGSRVAVILNGKVAIFHRPHPSPDTDKGAVKSVRKFLENVGVKP